MKYLIIDGMLNGTGIRDKHEGGYLKPEDLNLSSNTIKRLNEWLVKYEDEHYNGFLNEDVINELDREGKEIALIIKKELGKVRLEYFSDARMTSEFI